MKNVTIQPLQIKQAPQARNFCLKVIKEAYGFDYRIDWHSDLDSLLQKEGPYAPKNKGVFLIAKDGNQIIGTIGVKTLESKPKIVEKFQNRGYGDGKNITSIWRAYIRKDWRNKGVGKKLVERAEKFIRQKDFLIIYLHTSSTNPLAVKFWQNRGFTIILEENDEAKTVHMEKILSKYK